MPLVDHAICFSLCKNVGISYTGYFFWSFVVARPTIGQCQILYM